MKQERIIGIDIGGTKIQMGVILNGVIEKKIKFPTRANAAQEEIIQDIIQQIEALETSFTGIGIGVPGLVDEDNGIIYDLVNIPSWQEVHLKEVLEAHFQKPVFITNDANMFALGEKYFGKGRSYRNFVGITIGTGFGSGIFINNRLYGGNYASAGELGSMPYKDSTIETYCSGKFFQQHYGSSGFELFERAQHGDPKAMQAFREYGSHLGEAIKMILLILSPEAIFIGGSVSDSFEFFEEGLRESLNAFPFKRVLNDLEILTSDVSEVSLLGAAALVQDHLEELANLAIVPSKTDIKI